MRPLDPPMVTCDIVLVIIFLTLLFSLFQSGGYSDAGSTRSYSSSHSGGSLGSGSYGARSSYSGGGGYGGSGYGGGGTSYGGGGGYDSLPPRPASVYGSSYGGYGTGGGTYGSSAGYSSGKSTNYAIRILSIKAN